MMDSVLEEDVTLPGASSGCSGLFPSLPDDLDGISPIAGLGNGVLPHVSEETVSPTRARNMKDFENQITELKKENFNLKLRIYFLEERMQQEFDGPSEHVYKTNIELKVEVESLKRELQERERLLIKASKAVESLAEGGSEVQRVKEDAQKKVRQVEELLTKRIRLLEKDVKAAQAELEKAFAGTETEKALRLSLENKLSELKKMHEGDLEMALVLEEKDRLIEELKLSLKSKEALIQCLKEEKSQMASPDASMSSGELRGLSAALRGNQERETEAAQVEQEERNRFRERIQALQEDLREKEREIATEKKNSLKRDKAIQGLTMALKSKEKEIGELNSEIEELSAAYAKAREAPQKAQTQKFQGSEEYEDPLLEEAALLAELHSENLTKSTENHRLRRSIKKVTQELSDLQQERERLEKELEAAHRERSKGDRTIHDLRNEVEKLRNEVNEREKAVENRYKNLLNESNKKLHSQEHVIRSLTESAGQKDMLLQKFNEKELEAIQQNRCLLTAEDLEFRSEDLITEKCSSQSPGSKSIFSEEKQQLGYEELIQVLKKEQDIYTHLVKSLQDSDSVHNVQAELNSIFALRKRLERDVLSYQNLQKALEEQISEIRRREGTRSLVWREEEPFSFYSDQTSYLSICLEEHSRLQVEHFSQEELKEKVGDLIQLVKELYTDNQHLKKTIFDLSCMGFPGEDRPESVDQTELLASKEDEDSTRIGEDDENHLLSDECLERSNKIMDDSSKGGCKNGYLRHTDSNILDADEAHTSSCPGDQRLEEGELVSLLAPLFSEKAIWLLESRPELLNVLRELLMEQIHLTEQEASGEHLEGKTEKTLRQMAVQLRGELGHFVQANSSSKARDELRWPRGAQPAKAAEASMVEQKDACVQTMAVEGDMLRFRHEGTREAWEEKPADATFSARRQPENLCRGPGRRAAGLAFPRGTRKDVKKSRLPILIKPSQSLGSVCRLPAPREVVAQLQGQVLELQRELKEFKIHNEQLHQKLILAEEMMEETAPDKALLKAQVLVGAAYQDIPGEPEGPKATPGVWRDKERDGDQRVSYETGPMPDTGETEMNNVVSTLKDLRDQETRMGLKPRGAVAEPRNWNNQSDSEIYQPDDLAILPLCEENPSEDFPGPTSVATYLSSKSQFSTKVGVVETDQLEDIDTANDQENLKQKICDLETELDVYRNFILQLQKHSQFSEAIITVLCGREGAQDSLNKSKSSADEEEMTFSSLRQVRYVKHMKILHPLAPEMIDSRSFESLRQQLVDQEYELQKEQNLNVKLFGEIHNLQNKFRDLSPSRYDSLVQAQARELSLQRQQIKDSHGVCVVYRRHMDTVIKAFEELLQASDVDSCVAQGFQEQLNQCAELLGQLEKLFLKGSSVEVEMNIQKELRERLEEDNLSYQRILPESPAPSASRALSDCRVLSDCEMSEKSSFSRDQKQDSETEKTSVVANNFSQDLLMEHIQEIRSLRERLEESIKTNEKLRRQLERGGSECDQGGKSFPEVPSRLPVKFHQPEVAHDRVLASPEAGRAGSTNVFTYGSELHNSLTSEIRFLRKQNQALNTMLAKGSRDKQKENEKLREALSRKTASLEHLQRELTCVRAENERLQREVDEKEGENQRLLREVCHGRSELSRVQAEVTSRQQLLSQNDQLLQSLRVELKVHEKLEEEHRRPREARAEASGEGWRGQDPLSHLHGLLTEIQALRAQLERSIETNSVLQSRLEEQLARGGEKAPEAALTLALQTLAAPRRPLQLDKPDGDACPVAIDNSYDLFSSTPAVPPRSASETPPLSGNDMDTLSCDSGSSITSMSYVSRLVPGHRLWASKSGCHVLGLIEDYDALCEQIGQGQKLLSEIHIQVQEAPSPTSQELATKGPHSPLSSFATGVSAARRTLDEAARLLMLLWRVSLPTDGPCSLHCGQTGELKAEISKLHKKLFEQEKKLQNTMKLLQLSKNQEKVIFDQLAAFPRLLAFAGQDKDRGKMPPYFTVAALKVGALPSRGF
ncbi:CDK5 regulatory subunit-associated protein 2 isoform X4 [Hippopotamus amphibius kiboko]|uniref:CDK5 regulatory subunit-associated protein 2 isoform X4 n=1 Tax=Hippopotamus amphibius kiboko TaxID=575201 RepID=UPI0025913CF1|nr:CDK5 regulatory subunit-associated protein 2 isoform X4 [Hippopotamus amphibius kiboko]